MIEQGKQWEGQVVDGRFPLLRYAGGGERSAVFATASDDPPLQKAAIKLVPADPEDSEAQLARWRAAAKLSHPHLVQLFQVGRCQIDGSQMLYLVMDFADEDLSQVLPARALSPEEAREVLTGTLDALAYLHAQGFVHSRLRPANILAIGDQLKISSDGLRRAGEPPGRLERPGAHDAPEMARSPMAPAADAWSLGITVIETMTQRLPAWDPTGQVRPGSLDVLPAPFSDIARHCLERDPRRRWTVGEIQARLKQTSPVAQAKTAARPAEQRARRPYAGIALGLGLALAAAVALPILFNRHLEPQTQPSVPPTQEASPVPTQEPPPAQEASPVPTPESSPSPEASPVPTPEPPPSQAASPVPPQESKTPAGALAPGEVVEQVLPDVIPKARAGIRGTVKVAVKVRVDASGKVVDAELASAGPSKYFARLASEAAQRWRFSPRPAPAEWMLHFEFTARGTTVRPRQVTP